MNTKQITDKLNKLSNFNPVNGDVQFIRVTPENVDWVNETIEFRGKYPDEEVLNKLFEVSDDDPPEILAEAKSFQEFDGDEPTILWVGDKLYDPDLDTYMKENHNAHDYEEPEYDDFDTSLL